MSIKYDSFETTFSGTLNLDQETILRTASKLDLIVNKTDMRSSIAFLGRFKDLYPENTTTSEQFSMLMIFFVIRQTQGLKVVDYEYMDHLRKIQLFLKKNHKLSSPQIDFWKWFSLRI